MTTVVSSTPSKKEKTKKPKRLEKMTQRHTKILFGLLQEETNEQPDAEFEDDLDGLSGASTQQFSQPTIDPSGTTGHSTSSSGELNLPGTYSK
jgi:hypothetical protein